MKRVIVYSLFTFIIGAVLLLVLLDSAYGSDARLLGFDGSASMVPYATQMRAEGESALATLPDRAHVVVFRFAGHVQVLFDERLSLGNRQEAKAAIESIRPEMAPTDINAAARFAGSFTPVVQLILFSDMEQSAGKIKFDPVLLDRLPSVLIRKYGNGGSHVPPRVRVVTGEIKDWRPLLHLRAAPPATQGTPIEPALLATRFWIYSAVVAIFLTAAAIIVLGLFWRHWQERRLMVAELPPPAPPEKEKIEPELVPKYRFRIAAAGKEACIEQGVPATFGEAWDAVLQICCGTAFGLLYGPDETLEIANRGPGNLEIGAFVLRPKERRRVRDVEFLQIRSGEVDWLVMREHQLINEEINND